MQNTSNSYQSPVNIPLFKQKPFLRFDAENMNVLVKTAGYEHFFIIFDRLWSEKLFWLLERALVHPVDFVGFSIEIETIRYPTVIPAKNENFGIVQRKRPERISWRPHVMFVDVLQLFPFLLPEVQETVESLDGFERRLVQRVSSADDVEVSAVEHSHGVVVSRLFQVANIGPLVLRDVINLASFAALIGVLASDGVDEILGFELKLSVKVSKLVATSWVVHEGSFLNTICLLIDDVTFIWKDRSDIIFLFFTTDKEDFVLSLNRRKFIW